MATPAAFSRLQLAAALLEYDNDPDNPEAPYRSAQDSAIFADFRRNPAAPPDIAQRPSNHVGTDLSGERGSLAGRESAMDIRHSRGSIDALRNPFGTDNQSEAEYGEGQEDEGDNPEVDLASWGLDAFIPKEKKKSAKARGKEPIVNSSRTRVSSANQESYVPLPRRGMVTSKSISLGGQTELDAVLPDRRRSLGSPLDPDCSEVSGVIFPSNATTTFQAFEENHVKDTVPLDILAGPELFGPERAVSSSHLRSSSNATAGPKSVFEGDAHGMRRSRQYSIGTLDGPPQDNPFAIDRPANSSRFDPKTQTRPRSQSAASFTSRILLENEQASTNVGNRDYRPRFDERRSSTLELLRPKVLVMPSPLQSKIVDHPPAPKLIRDGFEMSADGPPLPPGARTSKRMSSSLSFFDSDAQGVPVASNIFTPNPLMDLSLSQKTFRNTLVVGSHLPYADSVLPRAEEGEQVEWDTIKHDDHVPLDTPGSEALTQSSRPAGKLYGKSLIDDLESRKAQMRSKQRVFKGDDRPSMMAREQRSISTLIDPGSLTERPTSNRLTSYGSQQTTTSVTRTGSAQTPLLTFGADAPKGLSPAQDRPQVSRSVFGVDTLWEREMAKLKELQDREEEDEKARQQKASADEKRRQEKQSKRKKRGNDVVSNVDANIPVRPSVALEPPILPDIQRATGRAPRQRAGSDAESDSEDETNAEQAHGYKQAEPAWHAGSTDEEDEGPRRTTGVGPRYRGSTSKAVLPITDNDSEEDVPLAATLHRVTHTPFLQPRAYSVDSDDEDKPLSHVLLAKSFAPPDHSGATKLRNDTLRQNLDTASDDDDQPLGSRLLNTMNHVEDDELPLAYQAEQQRRTQYQMLAHQQQQQMFLQAQAQSNMLMNASMMGGFYGPMMNPMMLPVPVSIPSPPPIPDVANAGRVDRWRHDVAVNAENT